MSNLTTSTAVDTFMQAANQAAMRSAVGAVAQLPAWTHAAPSSGVGTFSTDTAQPSDTAVLTFSVTSGGVDLTNALGAVVANTIFALTDSLGRTSIFGITSVGGAFGGYIEYQVSAFGGVSSAWSGIYTLSIIPTAQTYTQVGAASAAQGTLADTALQPNAVSGTFTTITVVNGLVTGGS